MLRFSNARSARMPAARSSAVMRHGLEPAGHVDDEHVDRRVGRRRTRLRRRTRAACGRRRARIRCRASPGRRGLDEPVVAAATTERVLRRVERAALRTRRSCGGSSRAPGPASCRSRTGCRAAREPGLHGGEVGGRLVGTRTRRSWAPRRSAAASASRFESSTRSGFLRERLTALLGELVTGRLEVRAAAPRRSGPGRRARRGELSSSVTWRRPSRR